MSTIDMLIRRFRKVTQAKTHEHVLTRTSKLEVMTSTQAARFRQLKSLTGGVAKKQASEPAEPLDP